MNWKPVIGVTIIGALVAAGVYAMKFFKQQQQLLKDYVVKVIGVKFSSFTAEIITVEFTVRITNKSAIEATVQKVYADIYMNHAYVGKVENVGSFVIPANGSNDIKVQFTFANKEFLKNIVSTLFTLASTNDVPYQLKGDIKLKSSFLGLSIPFDYNGSLKSDMLGKAPVSY